MDLRRRIVEAYLRGETASYEETAELFDVGRATVNRLLRRQRETGDVQPRPKGGNNPRRVDLEWLEAHAKAEPDGRLRDRIESWYAHSGVRVSLRSMWRAMRALGWTHKKKSRRPGSGTGRKSKSGAKHSSHSSQASTQAD